MSEEFDTRQNRLWHEMSQRFETVWKVIARPKSYSVEEIADAGKFFVKYIDSTRQAARADPEAAEVYKRIQMGIFHHPGIQEPPELKYKIRGN